MEMRNVNESFDFSIPPTKIQMENFGKAIVSATLALSTAQRLMNTNFYAALEGQLSHAEWGRVNNVRLKSPKSQIEFIEQLQAQRATSSMMSMQLSDLLRLAEKRTFPAGTISTQSNRLRLVHNVLMIVSGRLSPLQEWVYQEAKEVLDLINTYFQSSSFQEVKQFILTDESVLNGSFQYDRWLQLLKPMEQDVSLHLDRTLEALSLLPEKMLKKIKEDLSGLSLEQLQAVNVETIKETCFNEGLLLLRPLLVLMDMLVLLQQRRFYNEEFIIPKELAYVMELDGIDELIQELIRAKTPVAPVEVSVNSTETQPSPVVLVEVAPLVEAPVVVQEEHVNIPRPVQPAPSLSPQTMSDLQEIRYITRSRRIIERLNEMGFFTARQNGSHVIMHGPTGGQVVVPSHAEIPRGTRNSIIYQATAALQGNT